MSRCTLIILVLLAFFSSAIYAQSQPNSSAADVITVKTPQVQMMSSASNSTEVFMELDNAGNKTYDVVAAYSPEAKQVQLHRSFSKDDRTWMQQVRHISIASHHERDLKQGGFHVMLMDLSKPLNRGDIVPIILIFNDGSWLKLNVPVS
jgi:copper(I)-binding protein